MTNLALRARRKLRSVWKRLLAAAGVLPGEIPETTTAVTRSGAGFEPRRKRPQLKRSRGVWVWDAHGTKLLDARSGGLCVSVGHGDRRIADAVHRQLRRLSCAPLGSHGHEPASRLTGRLLTQFPSMEVVMFCSGGSEAVDLALKLVRKAMRLGGRQERTVILYREGSYHGASLGATSVTGVAALREPYQPLLPDTVEVCAVDCHRCPLGRTHPSCGIACVDAVEEKIIAVGPHRVAAMIAEPVSAWARVRVPPPEYWPKLQEVLRRHDVLLVLDEVTTGMGRTGSWLAADVYGIRPDVVIIGKGITGGYFPLSVVLANDRLTAALAGPPSSYTFGGHPAGCAAALATLPILEALMPRVSALSSHLALRLDQFAAECPLIRPIAGIGLLHSLALPEADVALRQDLEDRLKREGILCPVRSDSLQLAPPLCITQAEIDTMVDAVRRALPPWLELRQGQP